MQLKYEDLASEAKVVWNMKNFIIVSIVLSTPALIWKQLFYSLKAVGLEEKVFTAGCNFKYMLHCQKVS